MSDYYSQNDPNRRAQGRPMDYAASDGSGTWWIWGGIILVAVIVLFAIGTSGGGDGGTGESAATPGLAAPADDTAPAAPAPTVEPSTGTTTNQ